MKKEPYCQHEECHDSRTAYYLRNPNDGIVHLSDRYHPYYNRLCKHHAIMEFGVAFN